MNSLSGIRTNNDLATLKSGATVSYSTKSKQLVHAGKPLGWVFASRKEAESFAQKHGAFVKPV